MNPRLEPLWAPASLLFAAALCPSAGSSRTPAAALEGVGGCLSRLWPMNPKSLEGVGGGMIFGWTPWSFLLTSQCRRELVKGQAVKCPHAA